MTAVVDGAPRLGAGVYTVSEAAAILLRSGDGPSTARVEARPRR